MSRYVLILLLPLFVLCCGRSGSTKNSAETDKKEIKMPTVPSIYDSGEERGKYVAMHFWDNFDFKDTSYLDLPDVTEQAFSNYVHILNVLPPEVASASVEATMKNADVDTAMFRYFTGMLEQYLYEPNSPARNEELYIHVLQYVVASPKIEDIEKLRPQAQLTMALKNRVGDIANDILFTTQNGSKMRLHDVKSEYTLLYLNNPDCGACADLTQEIKSSDILMPLIRQGKLKVVALYPDEDLEAWRNHKSQIPAEWINGYDHAFAMRDKDVYDIKAIPSVYLLDKNKRVIKKDVVMGYVLEQYFAELGY